MRRRVLQASAMLVLAAGLFAALPHALYSSLIAISDLPAPPTELLSDRELPIFGLAHEPSCSIRIAPAPPWSLLARIFARERPPPGSELAALVATELITNSRRGSEGTFMWNARRMAIEIWVTRNWSAQQTLAFAVATESFGHGTRGVSAASAYYFGPKSEELLVHELAVLAVIPADPLRRDPLSPGHELRMERDRLLVRLHECTYIDDEEFYRAFDRPISAVPPDFR